MKRTRMEKGITLVALIITIVVLLILAVVAISSIQNDGILGQAQNAGDKYNQSVKDEKGILEGYLDYIDKHTGGWITIYEGNATTDESGMTVLGETDLFLYGALGAKYRITVESEEYTGEVEILPILIGTQEGMTVYALFAVENGEAIEFTSMEDAYDKADNLGENETIVGGIAQAGMCGIMLQNATDEYTTEYTITKIERKENMSGKKIFEGELKLISSETYIEMPEVSVKF